MLVKLNKGFGQLRDNELDNKAQTILAALTNNEAFPSPSPNLETVGAALAAYQNALAMSESPARAAQVTATREALETTLQQLAANLELTPNVADAQLATTGFDLPKERSRTTEPVVAPGNVRLKATGQAGEVQLLCESVNRAKTYQVQ